MDIKTGFFYLFSLALLFAAFRVITARNPVHAVLYLMLAFSQAAALWLMLRAEFLAIVLVLVYLGAVMVLFLFVVMMLDINLDVIRRGFWKNFPLAAFIGALIALEMAAVVLGGFRGSLESGVPLTTPMVADAGGGVVALSNSKILGTLLYTQYLYPLEIAAVILLVAMIAAIALTLRERKDTKQVDPSLQVRVRPQDRLRVLKMSATNRTPVAKQESQP
ncbi:MAG: NADH-quinone oxidoreductase subunit J [Burkholderiales bacterium]